MTTEFEPSATDVVESALNSREIVCLLEDFYDYKIDNDTIGRKLEEYLQRHREQLVRNHEPDYSGAI